jgi:hypothetical protein
MHFLSLSLSEEKYSAGNLKEEWEVLAPRGKLYE